MGNVPRELEFRMERAGLVKTGDRVDLKEDIANTMAGTMYYYTIKNAVAMSNNITERLNSLSGEVISVVNNDSIYTVTVKIDD